METEVPVERKKVLLLRTSNKDLKSYGGFQWPESGYVEAPDWNPIPISGGGLHGLLNGVGDPMFLSSDPEAKWQIIEAYEDTVVDLDGQHKVPFCEVVHTGDQWSALRYLQERVPSDTPICVNLRIGLYGESLVGGERSKIIGENDVTVHTADYSVVIAGYTSEVHAGSGSNIIAEAGSEVVVDDIAATMVGADSTVTAKWGNTVVGAEKCNIIAGDSSRVVGGYCCRLAVGNCGVVVCGSKSLLVGGDGSLLVGESESVFIGNPGCTFVCRWYNTAVSRMTTVIGEVREGWLKPGTFYRVEDGVWVDVSDEMKHCREFAEKGLETRAASTFPYY